MERDYNRFCDFWGLKNEPRHILGFFWDKLLADFSGEAPRHLCRSYFQQVYPFCESRPLADVLPLVDGVLDILKASEDARFLACVLDFLAFDFKPPLESGMLPDEIPVFGKELSGTFALMMALAEYDRMLKRYPTMGIPVSYAQDAMQWLGGNTANYAKAHDGRFGMDFDFVWVRHHADGQLFRIGRLEYLTHGFLDWMPAVFINREHTLAVLCRDGWRFNEQGLRVSINQDCVFTSRITDDGHAITGTPIAPDGSIDMTHSVTLDYATWKPAMAPWDLCVSMHIPGGKPMPFHEVKQSMCDAVKFFRTYFNRSLPLLFCNSWIFNPAWEELLPNGNMARFRRACYSFPTHYWGPKAGMLMLFGRNDVSPLELPATNSGQRAFQTAFRQKRICAGGILVLTDDLPDLTDLFYRKQSSNTAH